MLKIIIKRILYVQNYRIYNKRRKKKLMRYIDDGVVYKNEVSLLKKNDFKMSLIGHNNILFKSYYLISRLID